MKAIMFSLGLALAAFTVTPASAQWGGGYHHGYGGGYGFHHYGWDRGYRHGWYRPYWRQHRYWRRGW